MASGFLVVVLGDANLRHRSDSGAYLVDDAKNRILATKSKVSALHGRYLDDRRVWRNIRFYIYAFSRFLQPQATD